MELRDLIKMYGTDVKEAFKNQCDLLGINGTLYWSAVLPQAIDIMMKNFNSLNAFCAATICDKKTEYAKSVMASYREIFSKIGS